MTTRLPTTPKKLAACFWYDGGLFQSGELRLDIDQPGLLYGATVFTTLRVYQQSLAHPLTNWNGHCKRLQTSLQGFGWGEPEWDRLVEGANILKETYPVLRITVFPDGREWITGRCLPSDLSVRQQHGVSAWLADDASQYQRSLTLHKTGNYLGCWLALQAARARGAGEAILRDELGNWLETSTGNLWGWTEGCWWTPPVAAGILPGLARSQLIHWLKSNSQPVIEAAWTPERVRGFEALAYSNSVVELIPLHTILEDSTKLEYSAYHKSFEILRGVYSSTPGCEILNLG